MLGFKNKTKTQCATKAVEGFKKNGTCLWLETVNKHFREIIKQTCLGEGRREKCTLYTGK